MEGERSWGKLPRELQEAIWMHLSPKEIFYILNTVCKEWRSLYCSDLADESIELTFWRSIHNSSFGGTKRTDLSWMSDLKRLVQLEAGTAPLEGMKWAAEEGHIHALERAIVAYRKIKRFLKEPHFMDQWAEALRAACLRGDLEMVQMVVPSNRKYPVHLNSPLGSATAGGSLEVIRYLVEVCECEPTARCCVVPYGDSKPFHIAVLTGRVDIMRYFLSQSKQPDYYKKLRYDCDVVLAAARAGHLEVVRMLVEELAEQFATYADRFSFETASDVAIQSKHFHVADYLLAKGAAYNRTRLLAAAISYQKDEEVFEYLLNQLDEREPRWPIFRPVALDIAKYGYRDALSLALENSPDRGNDPLDDTETNEFMLHAIDSKSVDMCNLIADLGGNFMAKGNLHYVARFRPTMLGWLLEKRGRNVDSLFEKDGSQKGDTCLHILCRQVHDTYGELDADVVNTIALIAEWIDGHPKKEIYLNLKNNERYTPLMLAALECGGIEVFKLLIEAGASTEVKGGPNNETVLVMAVKAITPSRENLRVVKRLLANGAKTSPLKGYKILNQASKQPRLLKSLLRHTHAQNKVESLGGYSLHSYCRQFTFYSDPAMAREALALLFENGLDVNERDEDLTPLETILEVPQQFKVREPLFDILLDHGAMVTPLCLALSGRLGNRRVLLTLLQHFIKQYHEKEGKENESEQEKKERNESKEFAFLFAVFHGTFEEIKELVEKLGVDVNCQWDSSNPLHRYLDSNGVGPNYLSNGDTPLIVAGKAGEYESNNFLVDYLKSKGADPSIPNDQGQTIDSFTQNEDFLLGNF